MLKKLSILKKLPKTKTKYFNKKSSKFLNNKNKRKFNNKFFWFGKKNYKYKKLKYFKRFTFVSKNKFSTLKTKKDFVKRIFDNFNIIKKRRYLFRWKRKFFFNKRFHFFLKKKLKYFYFWGFNQKQIFRFLCSNIKKPYNLFDFFFVNNINVLFSLKKKTLKKNIRLFFKKNKKRYFFKNKRKRLYYKKKKHLRLISFPKKKYKTLRLFIPFFRFIRNKFLTFHLRRSPQVYIIRAFRYKTKDLWFLKIFRKLKKFNKFLYYIRIKKRFSFFRRRNNFYKYPVLKNYLKLKIKRKKLNFKKFSSAASRLKDLFFSSRFPKIKNSQYLRLFYSLFFFFKKKQFIFPKKKSHRFSLKKSSLGLIWYKIVLKNFPLFFFKYKDTAIIDFLDDILMLKRSFLKIKFLKIKNRKIKFKKRLTISCFQNKFVLSKFINLLVFNFFKKRVKLLKLNFFNKNRHVTYRLINYINFKSKLSFFKFTKFKKISKKKPRIKFFLTRNFFFRSSFLPLQHIFKKFILKKQKKFLLKNKLLSFYLSSFYNFNEKSLINTEEFINYNLFYFFMQTFLKSFYKRKNISYYIYKVYKRKNIFFFINKDVKKKSKFKFFKIFNYILSLQKKFLFFTPSNKKISIFQNFFKFNLKNNLFFKSLFKNFLKKNNSYFFSNLKRDFIDFMIIKNVKKLTKMYTDYRRKSKSRFSWEKSKQRHKNSRKFRVLFKTKNLDFLKRKKLRKFVENSFIFDKERIFFLKRSKPFYSSLVVRNMLFFRRVFKKKKKITIKRRSKYLLDPVFVTRRQKRTNPFFIFSFFKTKKWSIFLNNKFSKKYPNKPRVRKHGKRLRRYKYFSYVKTVQSGNWRRKRKFVYRIRKGVQNIFKTLFKNLPNNVINLFVTSNKYARKRFNTFHAISKRFFENIAIVVYRLGFMPSVSSAIDGVLKNWFCIDFELANLTYNVNFGGLITLYPSFTIFSNFIWLRQFFRQYFFKQLFNRKDYYQTKKPFLIFAFRMTYNHIKYVTHYDWLQNNIVKMLRLSY